MTQPDQSVAVLFDAAAFATQVRAKLKRDGATYRQAAPAIPCSRATLNRVACGSPPDVENYLRLCRWLSEPIAAIRALPADVPDAGFTGFSYRGRGVTEVMERRMVTTARWIATVHYRAEGGLVDVQHDLLELFELHDLVERGPSWDTIDRIEIVRADGREDELTIEKAAKL